MRALDLTGQIFGDFRAIKMDKPLRNYGGKWWKCECTKCGHTEVLYSGNITTGRTIRCKNCSYKERTTVAVLHRRYISIKSCALGNVASRRYNGVGIVPEWLDDQDAFINWAISKGYETNKGMQFTYHGNGKPVGPDTMAISTVIERNLSRTNRGEITYNGVTRNMIEWANIVGTSVSTISKRIHELGWSELEALFAKSHQRTGEPIYDHEGNFVCFKN